MKLTRLIRESIRDGRSEAYIALLEDWGRWASYRAGGPQGYAGGTPGETPRFIDDESALQIERALATLRRTFPRLLLVFLWHYKSGMDADDIEARVRGYQWGWDYELNHYHCNYMAIEEMIKRAELKVLDALRGLGR